jgi:hypothetical protein
MRTERWLKQGSIKKGFESHADERQLHPTGEHWKQISPLYLPSTLLNTKSQKSRFKEIRIKIPISFFTYTEKNTSKIYKELQKT